MSAKELLDRLIANAAIDLFEARGVSLEVDQLNPADAEYAAVIGFSGNALRGMTGIGMPRTTLETLSSAGQRETSLADAEDWLRESANQLLGRFKNKLLRYGVTVNSALPTVMQGERLKLLAGSPAGPWSYVFSSRAGTVRVWLEVLLSPGLELVESDNPPLQGAAEGDLMLF